MKICRNGYMQLQIRLHQKKSQKILLISGDKGFPGVSSKSKNIQKSVLLPQLLIFEFLTTFFSQSSQIFIRMDFLFFSTFLSDDLYDGRQPFCFFSQNFLRGHSNSPQGASDPKMVLNQSKNINMYLYTPFTVKTYSIFALGAIP